MDANRVIGAEIVCIDIMFESVLVPTDGSGEIERVVEQALPMAAADAAIHTVYVIDDRSLLPLGEDEQRTVAETLKADGESAVQLVADRVRDETDDRTVDTQVLQGLPANQILGYAAKHEVDAIVMGSHGQTARTQAVGSTTERVVRGVNHVADTTVVIVPIGPDDAGSVPDDDPPDHVSDMFQ